MNITYTVPMLARRFFPHLGADHGSLLVVELLQVMNREPTQKPATKKKERK